MNANKKEKLMTKKPSFSYSKLNVFKQCRKKYEFQYIIKPAIERVERPHLKKGLAAHKFIEEYVMPEEHRELIQEQIKSGTYLYKEGLETGEIDFFAPQLCTLPIEEQGVSIASDFAKSSIGQYYLSFNGQHEIRGGLTKDFEPCEYSSPETLFKVIVDYMFIDGDTLVLCDWKTGKYVERQWQKFTQLEDYAVYFSRIYPDIKYVKMSFVYLESGLENTMTVPIEHIRTMKTKELAHDLILAVNVTEFPATTSRLCPWCDFQELCEEGKRIKK